MAEIQTVFKRKPVYDENPYFLDLMTGTTYEVTPGQDFLIGRSLNCSLLIEEMYISRVHCVVKHEHDNFVFYDQSTSLVTFLNCKRMLKTDSPHVLEDGDIISFGDKKKIEYLYKFVHECIPTELLKTAEHLAFENLTQKYQQLKNEVANLNSTIEKITIDYNNFKENSQTKLTGFQKKIAELTTVIETHISNMENTRHSAETLKDQILSRLEDNFQCSICSEIVVKATVGNCNHMFCGNCISTWLVKSSQCPVCRSVINSTNNILAVDNFIDDICDLLGGSIKEQRETLRRERNVTPSLRVRSRFHSQRNPILPTQQERQRSAIRYAHRSDRNDIEVVDLTHLG